MARVEKNEVEKNNERKVKEIRCPHCFSKMIYYRSRRQEFQCRFCGNTFKHPLSWEE